MANLLATLCCTAALPVTGLAIQPAVALPPPNPYVAKAVCPGECCTYGAWKARVPLRAFKTEGDTTEVAFALAPGDTFRALTGNVHVMTPGIVRVQHAFTADVAYQGTAPGSWLNDRQAFAPRDTLWLLNYLGEGGQAIWYRGRVLTISEDYWTTPEEFGRTESDPLAQLLREQDAAWWVQVVSRGRSGWLRILGAECPVDGADPCG
jgi:hypothetical protein